jgi:hypothetical protein
MKKLALLLLLLTPLARAQYTRADFSLQTAQGQAVAGAQVYILTQPANTQALTPQASLFGSSTGTGLGNCGNTGGGALAQPLLTDGFGHACAYVVAGVYTVVYISPLTGTQVYPDQSLGGSGGGGSGSPGGTNLQFQFNNNLTAFGGSSLFVYNATNGPITTLPVTEVTSPVVAGLGACANSADPSGVLDSTCGIQAAINYSFALNGPSNLFSSRVHFTPGTYRISGTIALPGGVSLVGDDFTTVTLIQYAVGSDWIQARRYNDLSLVHPMQEISGLSFSCGVSSTLGSAYTGCTGTNIQLESVSTRVHDVLLGTGGRGINVSRTSEEIYIWNIFGAARWPINLQSQANTSLHDVNVQGGADQNNYCFGINCVNGVSNNPAWAPTSETITALSTDGAGNLSLTVNCAPSTCLNGNNLQSAGGTGTSAPIVSGQLFTLSGITASGLTSLNGTWKATSVTGTIGSPFTVTAHVLTGGQYTYGPHTGQDLIYTCGNNVTCTPNTPAAVSTTSPGSSALFEVTVVPDSHYGIVTGGSVVFVGSNFRIDPLVYTNGLEDNSWGAHIDGLYTESQFPVPNTALTVGGYVPYTTTTAAMNSSSSQTVPVLDTSWFDAYTTAPTHVNSYSQTNVFVFPCDFDPHHSGVPSVCVPGVNTNQFEEFIGTFTAAGFLMTARAGGSVTGISWPSGSLIAGGFANSVNAGVTKGVYQVMREGADDLPPANGYVNNICADNSAFPCGSYMLGKKWDYVVSWPQAIAAATVNPTIGGGTADVHLIQSGSVNGQTFHQGNLAPGCVKIIGSYPVTLDSNLTSFAQPGSAVTSGAQIGGEFSTCVVMAQEADGPVPSSTLFLPKSTVSDLATGGNLSCFADPNSAFLSPGQCSYTPTQIKMPRNTGAYGGPMNNQLYWTGAVFDTAAGWQDSGGLLQSASVTSWTATRGAGGDPIFTVVLQSTLNPPLNSCVQLAGLVAGAFLNQVQPTGTPSYGGCYSVNATSSTSFTISPPLQNIPANQVLSGSESTATATYPQPSMRFAMYGGSNNSGTNAGWDFLFNAGGNSFSPVMSIRQGSTAGSGGVSIPGALTTSFPMELGLLSNLNPNSANYSAGTWSVIAGTMTFTSGQTDQWGGTTATKVAITGTLVDNQLANSYPSAPLVSGNTYNFCALAKGNVGGETVFFSSITNHGPPITLSTAWQYICSTPQTVSGGGLNNIWVLTTPGVVETIFLDGVSTTQVPNSTGYLATGATPSPNPAPTLALPWLAPGNTCVGTGGILTTSGCSTSTSALSASLTTTSATTDNVTITGMTSSGHCSLGAQNASAATNLATTFISAYTTNQITVTHTATASMIYDFLCTAN